MHRRKTSWLTFSLLVLFWTSPSNSDQNVTELKNTADKFINHYSKKIIPNIEIPEKYKKALPENFHLRGLDELTYDFGPKTEYNVTTDPFKPFDKLEFNKELEGGSGSITYDNNNNFSIQFKKTF